MDFVVLIELVVVVVHVSLVMVVAFVSNAGSQSLKIINSFWHNIGETILCQPSIIGLVGMLDKDFKNSGLIEASDKFGCPWDYVGNP